MVVVVAVAVIVIVTHMLVHASRVWDMHSDKRESVVKNECGEANLNLDVDASQSGKPRRQHTVREWILSFHYGSQRPIIIHMHVSSMGKVPFSVHAAHSQERL